MASDDPKIGLRHSHSIGVDERLAVPVVAQAFTGFADMPPVSATTFVIGFVERLTLIRLLATRYRRCGPA